MSEEDYLPPSYHFQRIKRQRSLILDEEKWVLSFDEFKDIIQRSISTNNKTERITTSEELTRLKDFRHDQTKAQWKKNGIVQYKDDAIAILERRWGSQVQFIVACSQVTKEGYRLMSIDEGKEGSSGGFSGGVNAYFYFQRMDYVR
jgi:hypothetical protein